MKILWSLALCLLISACSSEQDFDYSSSSKSDEWEKDEMLTQINSLRKEIKVLKSVIDNVDEKLSSHIGGENKKNPNVLSLHGTQSLGSKESEFAIIEFSDFQCPYCARHDKQVLPKLKKKYIDSGKIKYMSRDYPLGFHKQAPAAAMAAHCAGDQKKYWPMRHKLFAGGSLNADRFKKDALALDLDMHDFNECMATNKYAQRVENDIAYGDKAGVDGTPRFYIGRIKGDQLIDVMALSGAQPFSAFERVIKQVMNKKS